MDSGPIVFIVIAACSAAAFSIQVIAQAVIKYRAQEIQAKGQSLSAGSDDRMARLEIAVESIALEVERISEGQRFTTKLLNEAVQHSVPRLGNSGKVNTPH